MKKAKLRMCMTVLVALFSIGQLLGQEVNVHGTVTDAESGKPLIGVHVYLNKKGTTTDSEGQYSIQVPADRILLHFQYVGYKTQIKEIFIRDGEDILLDVFLREETREIDEIVVSPSRMAQKISELTVSTGLIKEEELRQNHIINPEDIFNQSSGIEIMDGQASIRGGSGYSYGVGSRVLVLIDGLPSLSADAGNVKWSFMPLENLSQMEVIKGASSVLYGSSALNGIINFRTPEATETSINTLSLTTGIYGKPGNQNWKWWSTPRVYAKAAYSHLARYGKTGVGIGARLLYNNGYRRLNDEKLASMNLKLKRYVGNVPGLNYGVYLNVGYTERIDFILWEDASVGGLKQNEATANAFHGLFITADPFLSFNNNSRFKHDLRLRIQYSQNRLPESTQNNSDGTTYYGDYQLGYEILESLSAILGINSSYNLVISNFHGNHSGMNLAGYLQLDYRPFDRLKLLGGLRLEQYSLDGIHDKVIPIFRAGMNYHLGGYTFLRTSFGQGYRYPSIAEKFAATTVGSVRIFANPDIEPEEGWSAELGVKQGLSSKHTTGQLDLSLFYLQNENLIEYIFGIYPDPITQEGALGFRAVNTEHSRVYGFEIESALQRNIGRVVSSLRAGYTFMYPTEFNIQSGANTGTYLKYRRKHSLSISSLARLTKVEVGLNLFYKSRILNIDDVFLDPNSGETLLPGFPEYWEENNQGYFLADLYLSYYFSEDLSLSLGIKNIGNIEYMGRPGDVQPHRHFSLQFFWNL